MREAAAPSTELLCDGLQACFVRSLASPIANVQIRGSKFLKNWMEFLEEHADLRYPNLAEVYVDEQDG